MKTIKIFLASSEELINDRKEFGNLIRRLDDIYQKRGIHIQLIMWEDLDMTFQDRRKQDEYNDAIRQCHIFVALFYKLAGKYTREELEVANNERKNRNTPQIIIYCRDLKDGEIESGQLVEFKKHLETELGHFWGHYSTSDKLHLDFVMWLQRAELDSNSSMKVEDGKVIFEGIEIAAMSKLPFAASNNDYLKMKEKLEIVKNEIITMQQAIEQCPGVEMLKELLQKKLNEYNQLKKDFAQHQQMLLDTAKRISELQIEKISDNLRQAICAFEKGEISRAQMLLDEIANEAELHIVQLEQQRHLVHQDIKAFQLQARTILLDTAIPIEDRVKKTLAIYLKADDWASKSLLPDNEYNSLLSDFGEFLLDFAYYEEAKRIYMRLIACQEKNLNREHPSIASSYNNLGVALFKKGAYSEALDCYSRAIVIRKNVLGAEHPDTASSINRMGLVYFEMGNYSKALEYYLEALDTRKKILGESHSDTAGSYNNIGNVCYRQKKYDDALDYYLKSLTIRIQVLGKSHPDTAKSYNNIGMVFAEMQEYDKALSYYPIALMIYEKVLGERHPDTAATYNNIGNVYANQGSYKKALDAYLKSVTIFEKTLGLEHPYTAISYNNIGDVYSKLDNQEKARMYYEKSLNIFIALYGENHQLSITVKKNIEHLQKSCDL